MFVFCLIKLNDSQLRFHVYQPHAILSVIKPLTSTDYELLGHHIAEPVACWMGLKLIDLQTDADSYGAQGVLSGYLRCLRETW